MNSREARAKASQNNYGITWGVVRGQRIHLACATEDEFLLTWGAFNGQDHPDSRLPCERCKLSLSVIPDP